VQDASPQVQIHFNESTRSTGVAPLVWSIIRHTRVIYTYFKKGALRSRRQDAPSKANQQWEHPL
jgi:hypothetical protein